MGRDEEVVDRDARSVVRRVLWVFPGGAGVSWGRVGTGKRVEERRGERTRGGMVMERVDKGTFFVRAPAAFPGRGSRGRRTGSRRGFGSRF